jgi:hypothetical protein
MYNLKERLAELERKKIEIVTDHIRRCHDTNLDEAEKIVIADLNCEIKRLKGEV